MKKNIRLTILLLLITPICFSQHVEEKKLIIEGEKAFLDKDYQKAKEIYRNGITLYPNNRDFWFNLAATELNLQEDEAASEHFYQAYQLGDSEALAIIKENFPNFRNGSIMSIYDVEEKPKFLYGKKEYSFVVNNNLNPKYVSLLVTRFKWSDIISKYKGNISVQFQINKFNNLDVRILRVSGNQEEAEKIKKEMLSILKDLVVYVSAKHNGENVDLWEKWIQTFDFFMGPPKEWK